MNVSAEPEHEAVMQCDCLDQLIASGRDVLDYEKGISLGRPLSPLIGAFFLHALDAAAASSACSTSLHG
jgi:hypothetical protein